jgi:alanine-glyoxylate transaminase / serine-glyoxylate transaminase / serine-pyruvate transaminase
MDAFNHQKWLAKVLFWIFTIEYWRRIAIIRGFWFRVLIHDVCHQMEGLVIGGSPVSGSPSGVPKRLLLGPGPSNLPGSVLAALASPCVGHLDPYFGSILDEVGHLLRWLFQTSNALTIAVPGTGTAGMEACLANLLEPGDRAVVCVNGYFGARMAEIAQRSRAEVIPLRAAWGRAINPGDLEMVLKSHPGVKLVTAVHGETSTGVMQPLAELSQVVRASGALLLVDCVTTLGGSSVTLDALGVDAAYSASQKCLSCPPGLAPVSFSKRAVEVMERRKSEVASWYLDLRLIRRYWSSERKYHHTAPINMFYALREALRIAQEEGLEARAERHLLNHRALLAGLDGLGLELLVPSSERLPMLTAVQVPAAIDEAAVRCALLEQFNIEIGGGLGELQGKIWRIGLMGHSSQPASVYSLLEALETVLAQLGYRAHGEPLAAAESVYQQAAGNGSDLSNAEWPLSLP